MLILSFFVNLAVLVPLLASFAFRPDGMDAAFGQDTDARRILICLYATIALFSAAGLGLTVAGRGEMVLQLGLVLFAAQIAYKLMTVPMVGLGSPVVITNLAVVAVHSTTLAVVWMRSAP